MLTLPAPAKINLFLHIIGRREDGYHLLQTAFQLLDYGDELQFETDPSGALGVTPQLPGIPNEENLIYRAALRLREKTGTSQGAQIRVTKRLPSGAGLGGGSSDAATTLLALNRLWQLGLSIDQLAAIGVSLGADVPVFVRGHSAWAEGIGDKLTPVELPNDWFLVVSPDCHVDTGKIFCHEELTRNDLPIKIRAFLRADPEIALKNSCQAVVETLYPAVKEARLWLSQFADAKMTGTGCSLFARFATEDEAREVLSRLPEIWQGFVARAVNRSPVHVALKDD